MLKILAVTALSIGMATSAMAASSNAGTNANGGSTTNSSGSGTDNSGGSTTNSSGKGASGNAGSDTNGGTTNGTAGSDGKSQDCNAAKTGKNTAMSTGDTSQPAATASCK